jgi:hypothetical protein
MLKRLLLFDIIRGKDEKDPISLETNFDLKEI